MEEYQKEVYCNACGTEIEIVPKANVCKEYLSIDKEWGYFSSKDFMMHSFCVCEKCYDHWINTFVIPVDEKVQTEWACKLPEEILAVDIIKEPRD